MIVGTERLAMLFPRLLCTRKSYTTHYKAPILNTKPKFKPILIISGLAGGVLRAQGWVKGVLGLYSWFRVWGVSRVSIGCIRCICLGSEAAVPSAILAAPPAALESRPVKL